MLSEGRPGIDDKFSLKDGEKSLQISSRSFEWHVRWGVAAECTSGQLQLNLAKENYERSGLAGQAVKDGGRKHLKTRFGTSVTDGRCSSTYL